MRLIKMIFIVSIILIISDDCSAQSTNVVDKLKARYEEANIAIAEADINSPLTTALRLYKEDNEFYPTPEQGLDALLKEPTIPPKPGNWNGPYLGEEHVDPWGNKFGYKLEERDDIKGLVSYKLFSYGPDGVESEDDIYTILSYKEKLPLDAATKQVIKEKFNEVMSRVSAIRILDFKISDDKKIFIEGESLSMSKIFDLVTVLEDTLLFEGVRTEETIAGKVNDVDIAKFKLSCRISEKILENNDISMALTELKNDFEKGGWLSGMSFEEGIQEEAEEKKRKEQEAQRLLSVQKEREKLGHELSLLSARGQVQKALERVNQYIVSHPEDSYGYERRAYMYKDMGQYKESVSDFTKYFELCEDVMWHAAMSDFAELLTYLGDYPRAIEYFSKRLERDLQYNEQQKKPAQEYPAGYPPKSMALVGADPTLGYSFFQRANVYRKAGKYDQALNDLARALDYIKDPRDYVYRQVFLVSALTNEALGNREKVKENVDKLIALKGDFVECDGLLILGCSQYEVTKDGHIILKKKLPDVIKQLKPLSVEERLTKEMNLSGLQDVLVSDILGYLALQAGLEINGTERIPSMRGDVSLFRKVSIKDAIAQVCKSANLNCSIKDEILNILSNSK